MSQTNEKYRPYLTLNDMELCSLALKTMSKIPDELVWYLDKYIIEVKMKIRRSSITTAKSEAQKLEIGQVTAKTPEFEPALLYDMYVSNRNTFSGMNPAQIEIVKTYLYNNVWSNKECWEYEKDQGWLGHNPIPPEFDAEGKAIGINKRKDNDNDESSEKI